MVVPRLHQAHECRLVQVSEIRFPYLRAKRCARRDHVGCTPRGMARAHTFCASSHRFLQVRRSQLNLGTRCGSSDGHCALMVTPEHLSPFVEFDVGLTSSSWLTL